MFSYISLEYILCYDVLPNTASFIRKTNTLPAPVSHNDNYLHAVAQMGQQRSHILQTNTRLQQIMYPFDILFIESPLKDYMSIVQVYL